MSEIMGAALFDGVGGGDDDDDDQVDFPSFSI